MHGNSSSAESASEVPFEEEKVSSTKNGSDGKEQEEGISRLCESSSGNCKPENEMEVLETLTTGDSSESDGAPERKPMCDFSDHRSDVCDMEGDIRVMGKNLSSVMLVAPSDHKDSRDINESCQIRPYPRKFDDSASHG
ncbi:Glycosyltransferase [Musa troglodytarum]|uniref:Glycosyltransferase n=1 Tax=Musa troglodytarum TaxID=320322 RepID=A0A9E7H2J9_9LILI|nr:Glycosyltransferase [Musa troglodytarum]